MQGKGTCEPRILPHPLEDLQPVVAQEGGAGWRSVEGQWEGERVIWASTEVPNVATYNQVRILGLVPHSFWLLLYLFYLVL